MKKVLVLCLTVVMLFAFSVTTFAAPNGFVKSPEAQQGPVIVEGDEVIVTPFGDRDNLDDETKEKLEDAYNSIINADDLTELNDALKELAEELGIDPDNIAVSDLFDVDFDGEGPYTVTIKPETLENFVGLMRWDGEKWVLIDNAKVNGKLLTFSLDEPSQLAILVNAGAGSVGSPVTGDVFPWVLVVAIAASAIGLAVIVPKLIKKEV